MELILLSTLLFLTIFTNDSKFLADQIEFILSIEVSCLANFTKTLNKLSIKTGKT